MSKNKKAANSKKQDGEFRKGDVVSVCDAEFNIIARGLTNYPATDIQRIKGIKSDTIASVLGHRPYEEVIHRDNMVAVGK